MLLSFAGVTFLFGNVLISVPIIEVKLTCWFLLGSITKVAFVTIV
jgi:hypothetical protein